MRTTAAAVATALAFSATALAVTTANAADPTTGFTTVDTVSKDADIAVLTDGTVAVATPTDTDGNSMADTVTVSTGTGATRTTVFTTQAQGAQLEADGDTLWLLTWGTSQDAAATTLWRIDNGTATKVALPTIYNKLYQTDSPFQGTRLRVRDGLVAVFGTQASGTGGPGGTGIAAARLLNGSWTTSLVVDSAGGYATYDLRVALAGDHAISSGIWNWFGSGLYDLTNPAGGVSLGATAKYTPPLPPGIGWETTAWTWRSIDDRTYWQRTSAEIPMTTGSYTTTLSCKHVTSAGEEPCPAPAWWVNATVLLPDGTSIIGGKDAVLVNKGYPDGPEPAVQGGYALVKGDHSLTTLAGDPGTGVKELATNTTGTTVWSLTLDGVLQRLDLGSTPTPSPTSTTPAPSPTTTSPAPAPTKTPKPPKPTKTPKPPKPTKTPR